MARAGSQLVDLAPRLRDPARPQVLGDVDDRLLQPPGLERPGLSIHSGEFGMGPQPVVDRRGRGEIGPRADHLQGLAMARQPLADQLRHRPAIKAPPARTGPLFRPRQPGPPPRHVRRPHRQPRRGLGRPQHPAEVVPGLHPVIDRLHAGHPPVPAHRGQALPLRHPRHDLQPQGLGIERLEPPRRGAAGLGGGVGHHGNIT